MAAASDASYRSNPLAPTDPLAREWTMAVIGPNVAMAVAATGLGNDPGSLPQTVEFIRTDDRELVMGIAQQLMARVVPAGRRR